MIVFIIVFFLGVVIGYLIKQTKETKTTDEYKQKRSKIKSLTYEERQRQKILYKTDADRIREINLLSQNESKFMRILQHVFSEYNIIVKNRRFFIVSKECYPLAIFEYKDGNLKMRFEDKEDGLLLFFYRGMLSHESIEQDKKIILSTIHQ